MTRINLVYVEDLADQHLFAEWREIKMIPAQLRRIQKSPNYPNMLDNLPVKYTLNTGHVRFFYNKMLFLEDRYRKLTQELHKREYNIANIDSDTIFREGIPAFAFSRSIWTPNKSEIKINIDRIAERLHQRPEWYRYYGEIKPPEFFINKYNQQLLVDILVKETL